MLSPRDQNRTARKFFQEKPAILAIVREVGDGDSAMEDNSYADASLNREERKMVKILKTLMAEMIREE